MQFLKTSLILGVLLALITGCASSQPAAQPDDPHYAPVQPSRMQPPPATAGSLYQEGYGNGLYGDRKAYRVGDVITIVLEEQTQSSNSSSTDMSRETEVDIASPTIGGRNPLDLSVGMSSGREFSGDASADQSNSLQGSITATVHEVYPNGNLLIRGEKWLTLNQGSEYVRVSGIVRPEDIQPNNTVSSVQMADARLTYNGTGDLANNNRQGWLTRFFNSGWWPL
ncbi:flagellar basal body L-ring protein FlgH [Marinospirillum perlucidum]|uniref:flagellar basal body L-ring protein FlgH n=1 Tax=Marinospirillum perlucidum TaxID=1982602 RepID=UPI000DF39510|nr:flagellar basal body L-ring protein FlgH [Marinospirillum perlucidum]